jgi:hypothetical protein
MSNASINYTITEEDIDNEALLKELNRVGLIVEHIFDIEDDYLIFKEGMDSKFEDLRVTANCHYIPECRYQRNGDPGWPAEQDLEDLNMEEVEVMGKKINVLNIISDDVVDKIEEKIWEEYKYGDRR